MVMSLYDSIRRFFEDYIATYSEYGQNEKTISAMDRFYAPELSFPDDNVSGRDTWYKRCLNHPDVQDRLTIEHMIVDEKMNEVAAILKTEAVDRATGNVLLELKMNALYKLTITDDRDITIAEVRIFLESNPGKTVKLAQLYRIGMETVG
jgi:hypothetical protein